MNSNIKFNKKEIKTIIPHREPFLLIDEIIGGIKGSSVIADFGIIGKIQITFV